MLVGRALIIRTSGSTDGAQVQATGQRRESGKYGCQRYPIDQSGLLDDDVGPDVLFRSGTAFQNGVAPAVTDKMDIVATIAAFIASGLSWARLNNAVPNHKL